jgi:hypothetical protein
LDPTRPRTIALIVGATPASATGMAALPRSMTTDDRQLCGRIVRAR